MEPSKRCSVTNEYSYQAITPAQIAPFTFTDYVGRFEIAVQSSVHGDYTFRVTMAKEDLIDLCKAFLKEVGEP